MIFCRAVDFDWRPYFCHPFLFIRVLKFFLASVCQTYSLSLEHSTLWETKGKTDGSGWCRQTTHSDFFRLHTATVCVITTLSMSVRVRTCLSVNCLLLIADATLHAVLLIVQVAVSINTEWGRHWRPPKLRFVRRHNKRTRAAPLPHQLCDFFVHTEVVSRRRILFGIDTLRRSRCGGVAQLLGRRSLAGGLSLICARSMVYM